MLGACGNHRNIRIDLFRLHAAGVVAVTHLIAGVIAPRIQISVLAQCKRQLISRRNLCDLSGNLDCFDRLGLIVTVGISQLALVVMSPRVHGAAGVHCQHMILTYGDLLGGYFLCRAVFAQSNEHGDCQHNDNDHCAEQRCDNFVSLS